MPAIVELILMFMFIQEQEHTYVVKKQVLLNRWKANGLIPVLNPLISQRYWAFINARQSSITSKLFAT